MKLLKLVKYFACFCRCTIILLESNLNPTVKVLALAKSERTRDKQKVFYAFLMKVMAATSVVQFSTTHTDFFSQDNLHTFISLVQQVLIIVLLKRTYVQCFNSLILIRTSFSNLFMFQNINIFRLIQVHFIE